MKPTPELTNDDLALIVSQLKVRLAHVEARFEDLYEELQSQNEWLRTVHKGLMQPNA